MIQKDTEKPLFDYQSVTTPLPLRFRFGFAPLSTFLLCLYR